MEESIMQQAIDFADLVEREMTTIKRAADRIANSARFLDKLNSKESLSFGEKYLQSYLNQILDFMDKINEMSRQADLTTEALFKVIDHPMSSIPAPATENEISELLARIVFNRSE